MRRQALPSNDMMRERVASATKRPKKQQLLLAKLQWCLYSLKAPSAQNPQNRSFVSTCTQLTHCALLASNKATQLHNACKILHASVVDAKDSTDAAKSISSLIVSSTARRLSHTGITSTKRFRQVAISLRTQPLQAIGPTVWFQMSLCSRIS